MGRYGPLTANWSNQMSGCDWLAKRPKEVSYDFLSEVSSWMAKAGGSVAGELNELIQSRNFRAVVDRKIDYKDDSDPNDLLYARQIQALVSKQDWIDIGYDVKKNGLDSFLKAEERCLATNTRLDSTRPQGRVSVVSYHAVRKIGEILGRVPKLEKLEFLYGPGASTNVKSAEASAIAKLSAKPMCSEELLPYVGELLAEFPYLAAHHGGIPHGSIPPIKEEVDLMSVFVPVHLSYGKLVFVAKNSKTTRPIVVEPNLNGLAQKGIGTYLKSRMLRVANLDLSDQERNRALARIGSIDGSYSTIDLASASDTLSMGTVFELLPPDWADFLSRFRTGVVNSERGPIELEKFSSMGNGYTFELESLIFYSLAYGCCQFLNLPHEEISVFGDDIVINTKAYELLTEVLDYYGFEVNSEKSYSTGFFRESCGADWFRGSDIRPFYLRDQVNDRVLYLFHNWAIRHCERDLAGIVHSWTLEPLRLYGPDGYGDGHLIGSYSLRTSRKLRRSGYEGGFFDTYMLRPRRLRKQRPGDWLYPAYSVYTRSGAEGRTDPHIVRGSRGYVKMSIYTLANSIFRRS